MGVSLGTYGDNGAGGWSVITESVNGSGEGSGYSGSGTRKIYVSSSTGNDTTGTGTQAAPKATISGTSGGRSLLRDGSPDWLLLKKGDTWINDSFNFLTVNGQDASNPILLSSYGSGARPRLELDSLGAMSCVAGCITTGKGNFIALIGIDCHARDRDPANGNFSASNTDMPGLRWIKPFTFQLVEDCRFDFFCNALDHDLNGALGAVFDPTGHFYFRRNVISNSYSNVSFGEGFYSDTIPPALIEENVSDHNGWNETRGLPALQANQVRSRNYYIQYTCGFITFRGNISARSASEGMQLRSAIGSSAVDNLFLNNPIGFDMGHAEGEPLHTDIVVTYNVVLSGRNYPAGMSTRGEGHTILNCSGSGVRSSNNIIAHLAEAADVGDNTFAVQIASDCTSVQFTNNIIYDWPCWAAGNPIRNQGTTTVLSGNVVDGVGYPDPSRTAQTYQTSLGSTATIAAFMAQACLQSKDNWDPRYTANAVNNYVRIGFGQPAIGGGPPPILAAVASRGRLWRTIVRILLGCVGL